MGYSDHNTAMYMPLLDNSEFNTSDWCLNLYYRKMPQIIWDGILDAHRLAGINMTALTAPLDLKAPAFWKFSHLK